MVRRSSLRGTVVPRGSRSLFLELAMRNSSDSEGKISCWGKCEDRSRSIWLKVLGLRIMERIEKREMEGEVVVPSFSMKVVVSSSRKGNGKQMQEDGEDKMKNTRRFDDPTYVPRLRMDSNQFKQFFKAWKQRHQQLFEAKVRLMEQRTLKFHKKQDVRFSESQNQDDVPHIGPYASPPVSFLGTSQAGAGSRMLENEVEQASPNIIPARPNMRRLSLPSTWTLGPSTAEESLTIRTIPDTSNSSRRSNRPQPFRSMRTLRNNAANASVETTKNMYKTKTAKREQARTSSINASWSPGWDWQPGHVPKSSLNEKSGTASSSSRRCRRLPLSVAPTTNLIDQYARQLSIASPSNE